MTLGEKIRQARLEAGLSQRQLCGEEVTRNMLSQIENGTARPSMNTLTYFAARLGKPISYFLEEDAVYSPNQELIFRAREAVTQKNAQEVVRLLSNFRMPDPVFDTEAQLLLRLATLQQASDALSAGQLPYAVRLLEELGQITGGYCAEALERERLLLLGSAAPRRRREVCALLPSLDPELLLRARVALEDGEPDHCAALLEAAQDQESPQWNFLRAELYLTKGQYAAAAKCFHKAEDLWPERCAPRLELCYRELGDFQQAYTYACKQRTVTN